MNVLIIKLGALGDFLQAFDAFSAIRARHRADRVTLLTTAPYADLARHSPWFDRVLLDERPGWWDVAGLLRLRRMLQGYDFVYDLQTSARSSRYFYLAGLPAWSGIARHASHRHLNPVRDRMHNYDRQREQLAAAGVTAYPPLDLAWFTSGGPVIEQPYAMLAPGCSSHQPEKRWPAAKYGALAGKLVERGLRPVVVGTREEGALAAIVREVCPNTIDLTGQTSLLDMGGVAARAQLAVGNDTGPMHLAAVVGCPSVVLFSATSDPALAAPHRAVGTLREANLADLSVERVAACLP